MFGSLFKRRESDFGGTALTPLEHQRQKQVENLKKLNPTITELIRNEEFILNISSTKELLSLRIVLPPQFPQVKPFVTVSPPAHHSWINDQMQIVGSTELNNFSIHSELGQIILGVVEEFNTNPPHVLGYKAQETLPYTLSPMATTSTSSSVPNAVYKPGSGKSAFHLPFPSLSSYQQNIGSLVLEFPDLKQLSTKELQKLQNDEDRLQEYIDRIPVVKKMNSEYDELLQITEDLARANLSKEPILESNKKKLLEKIDVVSSLRQQFDELNHRHQILSEKYSPSSIQESLKFAALNAEDESEKIAEAFLEGKMEIEEFLHKFMERRILSHCRRGKEEKLHQQLTELKKSGF